MSEMCRVLFAPLFAGCGESTAPADIGPARTTTPPQSEEVADYISDGLPPGVSVIHMHGDSFV